MVLVFPTSPAVGDQFMNWQWDGHKWTNIAHGAVPEEAPSDGVTYGRLDETWQPVVRIDGHDPMTGNLIVQGRVEAGTTVAAGQVGLEVARDSIFHGTVTVPTPVNATDAANKQYVDDEFDNHKHAETITGDGTEVAFDIPHALGTTDILVQVYDDTTHDMVLTDVMSQDPDEVTVSFALAPAAGKTYRVVVMS